MDWTGIRLAARAHLAKGSGKPRPQEKRAAIQKQNTRSPEPRVLTHSLKKCPRLLGQVDLGNLHLFLAVNFLDRASSRHFLGGAAHVVVKRLSDVVVHQVIRYLLSVLAFGLNDRLAF